MTGISSKAAGSLETKQKFVSQELDEELDLNWYQFRFRNHDPQIGRFIQIDPLASDYEYNSTYAYAENKVIDGIDLEGLEHISNKQFQEYGYGIVTDPIFNNRFRSESTNQNYQAKAYSLPMSVKASENTTVVQGEPLMSLNVSVGAQVGVKAGPVGGEINFGSKELGSVSGQGVKVGNWNETKKGMELNLGVASISGESTTVTEAMTVKTPLGNATFDKTTSTNTYKGSIGIPKTPLQVGTQRQQVYEQYTGTNGSTTNPVLVSDSRNPAMNAPRMYPQMTFGSSNSGTKISAAGGLKVEATFRILDILGKVRN